LHYSLNIAKVIKSRGMRWSGYVTNHEGHENCIKSLIGKSHTKRLQGGISRRDWIDLARHKSQWWVFVKMVMSFRVP